ncbi:MAG: cyclin family protein [Promethearchaeota archaeon]
MLAKHPTKLELDSKQLAMMFYSCAKEETDEVFQIFPSSDVDLRAAAAYRRIQRGGKKDDFCVVAFLLVEEEGTAYQEVLMSTLQEMIEVRGDSANRRQAYRKILSNAYKQIKRRGGYRDKSLCPYMYERPLDNDKLASFCRVVKKPCYLSIYEMQSFTRCPRYLRRQRKIQLANARRIVHAGIQRILEKADSKRQMEKDQDASSWTEPIHEIIEHLFSVFQVKDTTIEFAHQIIDEVGQKRLVQGHPRPIVAASIAYLCAKQMGDDVPENDIIELVGCSRTSLRRNYSELIDLLAEEKNRNVQPRRRKGSRQIKRAISKAE